MGLSSESGRCALISNLNINYGDTETLCFRDRAELDARMAGFAKSDIRLINEIDMLMLDDVLVDSDVFLMKIDTEGTSACC